MLHHYRDIRDRIAEEPKWFDEHGVPRYCDFHPSEVADIYAEEVAVLDIACQNCGRRFKVVNSDSRAGRVMRSITRGGEVDPPMSESHNFGWGDPPNVECCPAGPTMSSMMLRVSEFWRQSRELWEWERVPECEVLLYDHPDYVEPPSPTEGQR